MLNDHAKCAMPQVILWFPLQSTQFQSVDETTGCTICNFDRLWFYQSVNLTSSYWVYINIYQHLVAGCGSGPPQILCAGMACPPSRSWFEWWKVAPCLDLWGDQPPGWVRIQFTPWWADVGVSENRLNPIVPNGFADHYPVFKWLAIIGNINPTFSDIPMYVQSKSIKEDSGTQGPGIDEWWW